MGMPEDGAHQQMSYSQQQQEQMHADEPQELFEANEPEAQVRLGMHMQAAGLSNPAHDKSGQIFHRMFMNITTSETMMNNEHIRQVFKLEEIKEEEDLHSYKNLLNCMGAIFYADHGMKTTMSGMFAEWI